MILKSFFNQAVEYCTERKGGWCKEREQHSMRWNAKPCWERLKGFLWLLITWQKTGEGRSEREEERKVETTV